MMIFIHIAAKNREEDALNRLLEATANVEIKERLRTFVSGEIERKINIDSYDIEAVISYAESIIGTPHRMGGSSTKGLDCSGLVMLAHSKEEVILPHGSQEQAKYGRIMAPDEELKRGDLVFFHSTYRTAKLVTHAGIYLGEDQFIHTSSSKGVMISEVAGSAYWSGHYLFATRLVE